MRFLSLRGTRYQFERPVPRDVQATVGRKSWRESLKTDSRTEAEIRCRRRTVETDEIIQQVRNNTYRHYSDDEIDDMAIEWSLDFQHINRENIAKDAFPDVFSTEPRLGEEDPSPIFRSRSALAASVSHWMNHREINVPVNSTDWDALIDACLDEYLTSNPELSDAWIQILNEKGLHLRSHIGGYHQVVQRSPKVDPKHKLSAVFKSYLDHDDMGPSARSDFSTSVRRFIQLHGDMDVTSINRRHVENFRDQLKLLPSRPPNAVREMTLPKQVEWADGRDVKRLGHSAINKNLMGVKLALNYAFKETSIFEDRDWRNPFDGFGKKPKKADNPIKPFSDEQLAIVYSSGVYETKTAEKFWIPLVLFFTGARLDEISQLHVTDIKRQPVAHIVAENLDEDDPALAKKVKSISSHRTIPIHNRLIELGFLEYVEAIQNNGHTHVFPNLPHHQGGKRGNLVSRDFINRFRKFGEKNQDSGLNTLSLVTHSLRHSFRIAGYRVPEQEFVQVVMGHYVGGVSFQTYGPQIYHMPDILAERVMDIIPLPEIDMPFLKVEAQKHLSSI